MTNYIGDKSQFEDKGLEPLDFDPYVCPVCGFEKDVPVQFDLFSRFWYPLSVEYTRCNKCGGWMEKK
jgi:hypothetical protein